MINTKTSDDDFTTFLDLIAGGKQSDKGLQGQNNDTVVPLSEDKSIITYKGNGESTKSSQNNVEDEVAPSTSAPVGVPVHHDTVVSTPNNGVKCKQNGLIITLVGVVLIATISTLSVVLVNEKEPAPLPPLTSYQPYVEVISSSRIIDINESPAEEDTYPYIVSLKLTTGEHCCGGSLIARDVVLTAAHCQQCTASYVVVGRHDLSDDDGDEIYVREEMPHPNYYNNGLLEDNDFMLVFLEGPSTTKNARTVKLNSIVSVPNVGEDVIAMGWGDTDIQDDFNLSTDDDVKMSDVLMDITVQVISKEDCENGGGIELNGNYYTYMNKVTENMLCAKDEGQDACQGDSGGPLVVKDDDGDVQVGVISGGISCAMDQFPGVYARVSQAYKWIQEEVCKGSAYASEAGFDCGSTCIFCPVGLTADEDWIPQPEEGNVFTCQGFMDYGSTIQAGSEICEEILKSWEPFCCPSLNPCVICPYPATVDGDYAPFDTFGVQTTCGEIMKLASLVETGSEWCINADAYAPYCCPSEVTPVPTPSPMDDTPAPTTSTSSGSTLSPVDDTLVPTLVPTLSPVDDTTPATTLPSTFSGSTPSLEDESPVPTLMGEPSYCFICQEGSDYGGDDYCITHPEYCNAATGDEDSRTCKEIVELYSRAFYEVGSIECGLVDLYEVMCCPTVPENPCTICQDGPTAGDDFAPYEGNPLTCSEFIEIATLFETGSYQCGASQVHELLCCFTGPEDPCILCPTNGATAGDDFIPVEYSGPTATCADLIASAQLLETESDFCVMHSEVIETNCCPTLPDDPAADDDTLDTICNICPNGVTISEGDNFAPYADADAEHLTFYIGQLPNPSTCGELIDAARQYETGTEECAVSEVHELYCCPTPSDDRCIICPNGATIDDKVPDTQTELVAGSAMTCEELIDNAALFDRESDYCEIFGVVDEEDCCP